MYEIVNYQRKPAEKQVLTSLVNPIYSQGTTVLKGGKVYFFEKDNYNTVLAGKKKAPAREFKSESLLRRIFRKGDVEKRQLERTNQLEKTDADQNAKDILPRAA